MRYVQCVFSVYVMLTTSQIMLLLGELGTSTSLPYRSWSCEVLTLLFSTGFYTGELFRFHCNTKPSVTTPTRSCHSESVWVISL